MERQATHTPLKAEKLSTSSFFSVRLTLLLISRIDGLYFFRVCFKTLSIIKCFNRMEFISLKYDFNMIIISYESSCVKAIF